jgi:hypothetical protein
MILKVGWKPVWLLAGFNLTNSYNRFSGSSELIVLNFVPFYFATVKEVMSLLIQI